MNVTPWERDRAQLLANAMRELVTRGTEGAEVIYPVIAPANLPAETDSQVRLTAYGIVSILSTHEPWITVGWPEAPAFENSCSSYGAGNRVVQFRKENGRVHIRGLVLGASIGTVIFTLPAGYRPVDVYENFSIMADGSHANLVIQPDGLIYINIAVSGTPENYASFAGVNFFPD